MSKGFAHLRPGALLLLLGFALLPATGFAADLSAGERALLQGRAGDATRELRAVLAQEPNNGKAHLLLCRTFYSENLVEQAVGECEASLTTLAGNSEAQDWMGRAYGMKADRSGPISGFGLARRVKAAFEAAVRLDPGNGEAVDDLGEYYVQAPGVVGGGIDKATALASRARVQHPERSLRIEAMIAEKQKDDATAERDLRARIDTTGGRADTWIDLANYYGRQNQPDQAVDALHHAYASDKLKGPSLVSLAMALNKLNREPELAQKALQDYLGGHNWDDTAPTFKARTQLARMLAARGNKSAAKIELDKALMLAPDFEPAKKLLSSLQVKP